GSARAQVDRDHAASPPVQLLRDSVGVLGAEVPPDDLVAASEKLRHAECAVDLVSECIGSVSAMDPTIGGGAELDCDFDPCLASPCLTDDLQHNDPHIAISFGANGGCAKAEILEAFVRDR